MKTKLEDIKVKDFVNLSADHSNGHDFAFVDLQVTSINATKNCFGDPCIELHFGKRVERYSMPCRYLFDVKAL